MAKKFQLTNLETGKSSELSALSPTLGPDVVNIGSLNKDHGVFTFDPGFMSTASCESKITYIDGDNGVLLYRGYPVEQLAEKSSFLEVSYLLINGELPTAAQLKEFTGNITRHTMLNETLQRFYNGFNYDAHPMAMVSAVVASMAAFYHDAMDIYSPRHREIFAHRMLAKIPTIAAAAYKHSLGQPFMHPKNDLDYCSNLLNMFFAVPCEDFQVDPVAAEALDLLFILHADHEQNASTSTVRLAGSTGTNPYAAISAGVSALWGPSHGGANESVLVMLEEIGTVDNISRFLAKVKDKEDNTKLMGFGHRVYKSYDPRAAIVKGHVDNVLDALGVEDPLLEIARTLEATALSDDFFVSRKLYPNVDFYTGIVYKAMGFSTDMFTVLFALGRLPGWVAQWREMVEDPTTKIGRPRQVYIGSDKRDYVAITGR